MQVFVLGAGASVHAGYPLMKDLGRRLIEWTETNPRPVGFPHWPNWDKLKVYGSFDDIEEIVTKLEAAENAGAQLAGLREALCRFFELIRPPESLLYKMFADETVKPGDVILTFNYDLSLEIELKRAGKWEVSDGYGFDLGIPTIPNSNVKLLKLHGSINWLDSFFGGMTGMFSAENGTESRDPRPVFPWGLDHLGYPGVKDPMYRRGGVDRSGSMILPSRKKQYHVKTPINDHERMGFWNLLWGQAGDALRQADEIIIIGYSLPVADDRARTLLLVGSNHDTPMTICCGQQSESLGHEFAAAGFKPCSIRTDIGRFEDWLAAERCVA